MIEEDSRMPQPRNLFTFTGAPRDRLSRRLDKLRSEYGTNVSKAFSSYAQAHNRESMP